MYEPYRRWQALLLAACVILPIVFVFLLGSKRDPQDDRLLALFFWGIALLIFLADWRFPSPTPWLPFQVSLMQFYVSGFTFAAFALEIMALSGSSAADRLGFPVWLILAGGLLIWLPLVCTLTAWATRWLRQKLSPASGEQPSPEVIEALERARYGWGSNLTHIKHQALATLGYGVGAALIGLVIGLLVLLRPGPLHIPSNPFFDFMGIFFLFGGSYVLCFNSFEAAAMLHSRRVWRQCEQESHVVEGLLLFWRPLGVFAGEGERVLVKIQQADGADKLLVARTVLFTHLPQDTEYPRVRLEYLTGTKQVVNVETIQDAQNERTRHMS